MVECPTIKTENGLVKGKVSKATDPSAKPVFNFLGIPYGKPPVGSLRFLAPVRAAPWEGTFEAVHTYKLCPQDVSVAFTYDQLIPYKNTLNHDGNSSDEDCLRLNVFTPQCVKTAKLPVMVWLTGGHYQRNFGGRRNGTPLAGMHDTVIVVPNFRVNAFGFLTLGKDSCCPGNAALLDVVLALEWVRDNIAAFGGDPENVTLFGESSGSGMTQVLMMSPLTKGLIHKAILMSGSILTPLLFNEDISIARDAFLSNLGLNMEELKDKEILKRLQQMPADEILSAVKKLSALDVFLPTVDGHVISDSPANLMRSGNVHRIPLMIGCTNSEGSGILSMRIVPGYDKGLTEEVAKMFFTNTIEKVYKTDKSDLAFTMVKELYKNILDQESPLRFSQLHGEVFSDSVFVVPSVATAAAHSAMGNPTFFYQMTQQPEFNHSDVNGPKVLNRADYVKCDHADDLHFVWGEPFEEGELSGGAYFTDDEIELSRHVMKYFTNFAKTGNPNKPEACPVEWPLYDQKRRHMVLRTPLNTDSNLAQDKVVFFTQTLPNLSRK